MSFKILQADPKPIPYNAGAMWIRPMQLGSGWAAVMMWINNEMTDLPGLFPEPWNTGFGRYATKEEAAIEAYAWGVAEEVPVFLDGCKEPR